MNFNTLKINKTVNNFENSVTILNFKRNNLSNQMMKNRKNKNDKKNQNFQSENNVSQITVMNHLSPTVS